MLNIIKKHLKRGSAFILSMIMFMGSIEVYAVQTNYSADLGTNAALGSPLLNESFESTDWDPYEMVVFGIFLSNFCINWGEDNYETAFSQTAKTGLKGKALESLVFGTGTDSVGMQSLKSMLQYAVDAQKNDRHKIEVRYKYKHNTVDKEKTDYTYVSETYADAKGKDLFFVANDGSNSDYTELMGVSGLGNYQSNWTDIETKFKDKDNMLRGILTGSSFINFGHLERNTRYYAGTVYDVELSIKGAQNNNIVIFDSSYGWDTQQYGSYIMQGWSTGTKRDDNNWLKSIADSALYLDCFGNICCDTNEVNNAILFPAACNQHLTKDKMYNYVTIGTINDYYTKASGTNMVQDMVMPSGSSDVGMVFEGSNKDGVFKVGERIVGFDTDTMIGDFVEEHGAINYGGDKDAEDVSDDSFDIAWGQALNKLIQSDIESASSLPVVPTTFLLGGATEETHWFKEDNLVSVLAANTDDALGYREFNRGAEKEPKRLTKIWTSDGDISIFGDPVYVIDLGDDVQDAAPEVTMDGNLVFQAEWAGDWRGAWGKVLNQLFQYIGGTSGVGQSAGGAEAKPPAEIQSDLNSLSTLNEVGEYLFLGSGSISALLQNAILAGVGGEATVNGSGTNLTLSLPTEKAAMSYSTLKKSVNRVFKLYPCNETMEQVLAEFTSKQGTNFDYLCSYVYITYLQWYGIVGQKENNLDPAIFDAAADVLQTDADALFGDIYLDDEEKKRSVLDYTYMILNPSSEKAKQYRQELLGGTLTNFLYDEYKKLSNKAGTDSVSYSGFFNISSLSENFLTSWIVKGYIKVVIGLIGIGILGIIVYAVIRRKKLNWVFFSAFLLLSLLLVFPNLAEVTPYVSSLIVQNTFDDNLDYWIIAESAGNLEAEGKSKHAQITGGTSAEEKLVNSLKSKLSTLVLDNSLMIKNDISKKVNANMDDTEEQIQSLASARWLMPILMQQYSSTNSSADYVYVPLNNMYEDMQNLYWYYVPGAKITSDAVNSGTNIINCKADSEYGSDTAGILTDATKLKAYDKYIDTSLGVNGTHSNLNYSSDPGNYFLSVTRSLDNSSVTHAGFYLVDWAMVGQSNGGIGSVINAESLKAGELTMEEMASSYKAEDGSQQCFGYLWTTMNPGYYFYMLVRDTCNGRVLDTDLLYTALNSNPGETSAQASSTSLSSLIGSLQGQIVSYVDTSADKDGSALTEVDELPADYEYKESDIIYKRNSFMHANGYIRDFLDLEELFTNVIPYLNDMYQIAAGDTEDPDTGLMTYTIETPGDSVTSTGNALFQPDELMSNYTLYKGNNRSWFWRSNWAVKIKESKTLSREKKVVGRSAEGKRVTYDLKGSPLDPRSYPAERPMVFSEAQMHYQNLKQSDLTLPELKILKVNEAVEKKWTYLINYANTSGITEETFYRVMALDAMMEFNKVFDTSRLFNASHALYPQTVDLRNLSFDSVIKLLMINSTRNTQYMSTDVIQSVINAGSSLNSFTLLLCAYICNVACPVVRDVFVGILFYLLIWALATNIFAANNIKRNIVIGYLIANGIFAAINIMYFMSFSLMISKSSLDSVLTEETASNVSVSPAFVFFVLSLAGILAIAGTVWLLRLVIKNRKDMGFAKFMFMGQHFVDKFNSKVGSITGKVKSTLSGSSDDTDSGKSKSGDKNSSAGKGSTSADNKTNSKGSQSVTIKGNVQQDDSDVITTSEEVESYGSGYSMDSDTDALLKNNGSAENKENKYDAAINASRNERKASTQESIASAEQPNGEIVTETKSSNKANTTKSSSAQGQSKGGQSNSSVPNQNKTGDKKQQKKTPPPETDALKFLD